jgi:hypothetical protein
MIIGNPYKIGRLVLMLLLSVSAVSLSSCEFGANAVDGGGIQPEEGTVFTYDSRGNQFNFFRPGVQLSDEVEIKFLSKIATIGDRDHVFGFQSSINGELLFSDVRNGDLAVYFQANRDFENPIGHFGEWIRIPLPGDQPYSTTIEDSVFSANLEIPSFIQRTLTIEPIEIFKFYVDGYYFNARKVRVTSDYRFHESNDFGERDHDEQELTFLEGLGVLAEKVVNDQSGFSGTSFIMNGIQFRN